MKKYILLVALYGACITMVKSQEKSKPTSNIISVTVLYDKAVANDTLVLKLSHSYGETHYDITSRATQDADHRFRFQLPVTETSGYFKIQKKRVIHSENTASHFQDLTRSYIWEKDDQIVIEIRERKTDPSFLYTPYETRSYQFSGKGREKYVVQNLVDSALYHTPEKNEPVLIGGLRDKDGFQQSKKAAIAVLDRYKGKLSAETYHIMKADILFYVTTGRYIIATTFFKNLAAAGDSTATRNFIAAYNSSSLGKTNYWGMPAKELAKSSNFLKYCLKKLNTDYFINHGTDNADSVYYAIKRQFRGSLQEKLIVAYFLTYRNPAGFDKLFKDASASISQPHLVDMLKNIRLRLPGVQAYNFSLSDTSGKPVQLSDFSGKVVLIDLWFDNCGGCQFYFSKTLSKAEKYFEHDSSVVFISVSVDIGKAHWLRAMYGGEYTSLQAINLYTSGKGINHPFIDRYGVWDYPTAILIDGNMKISKYNTFDLFSLDSLIDAIQAAKKNKRLSN